MVQLIKLLGNKKVLCLFRFLAVHPGSEYSYSELQKKTKLSKATLAKWLNFLEKEELISLKQIGRNKLYRIKNENCLVKQFKVLDNLSALGFLARLSNKLNLKIYLFGSAARGEDKEDSDLDLLVLGKVKKEELWPEIKKYSKQLGKALKLQIFTLTEWSILQEKDPAFYERVEKDKILIS